MGRMCPSSCPKRYMTFSEKPMRSRKKLWKGLILAVCIWLVFTLATWPVVTAAVYETIFQYRFETEPWLQF